MAKFIYLCAVIFLISTSNNLKANNSSDLEFQRQVNEACGEKSCEFIFKKMKKFAKNGSPRAQATLALLYAAGVGTEMDPERSVKYMKRAARNGLDYAEFKLGMMYRNGQFVEKDKKEAEYWLFRAANDGYEPAIEILIDDGTISTDKAADFEAKVRRAMPEDGVEVIVVRAEKYSLSTLYELLRDLGYSNGQKTGSRISGRGCGNSASPCATWNINTAAGRSEFNTMISKLNAVATARQMGRGGF